MHDHGHFWRRHGKPILGTLHTCVFPLSTTPQAFAYGRFLGDYRAQREVGALALAELRPTVPE
ncbi:MAG TPA: hypothetical protein VET30_11340, partial [Pseudoxanthomonas sp.]|nr:hypothetical protein [Pseudoxanthomonas sp.]